MHNYRPKIKPSGTIMVISPAWYKGEAYLYHMEEFLNALGFEVEIHPHCYSLEGQFAGTIEERVCAINEAFLDDSIDAIICSAGGYGSLQLLDKIDYDIISKNPKPFIGYSDITALLNAINSKSNIVTYHSIMGNCMNDNINSKTLKSFFDILLKDLNFIDLQGSAIVEGVAEGVLVGGNMTVFDQLIGTGFMPKHQDIILFLEDTKNEKINELDKKILHLKHSGFLQNVRGVILGEMDKLSDNEIPFAKDTKQIIKQYLPDIPNIHNVKCGHEDIILTFPVGAKVKLNVGSTNRLDLL